MKPVMTQEKDVSLYLLFLNISRENIFVGRKPRIGVRYFRKLFSNVTNIVMFTLNNNR